MSDDTQQTDGEIFNTDQPDSSADVASTTDDASAKPEEVSADTPSEESEEALNLDVPEKEETVEKGEKNRQKQIDVWQDRVESGKVKLEDVPKKWLKDAVSSNLENKGFAEADSSVLNEIVAKELDKREAKRDFELLKSGLSEAKLSKDQKIEIESSFKDLISDGLPKLKALQAAMRIAGIHDLNVESVRAQKASMKLPKPGNYKDGKENVNGDNWRKKLTPEERIKKLDEMTSTFGEGRRTMDL